MRIHFLSQWYAPEPDAKKHILARELAARGHEVTVITGYPNYPEGVLYPGYRIRWRQWEHIDGVKVLRVPLYPDHSRSALRRIANYSSFACSAALLAPALVGPADVMWVYHPPLTVGIPAILISALRHIPFVYEVQDMWPETLAATGMISSERAIRAMRQLASFVYRKATVLSVISPGFKQNLIGKGVPEQKIQVIPNWADEDIYRPVARNTHFAEKYGMSGKFNVLFAGNLGAAQALDNVLNAAILLRDLEDLQFVFVGEGIEKEKLCRRSQEMNLTNVRFVERHPARVMPDFYANADVLLVHLKNDPLFEITIPSKITAYLACGRPILAALRGDAAHVVNSAGAGLICETDDPKALAQTVRQFYSMAPEVRDAMGVAGRRAYLAQYTRAKLVDKYEQLFAQIASMKAGEFSEAVRI
jgi:glycosyltransferase involved in cell wall biosynthesis